MAMFKYQIEQYKINNLLKKYPEHKDWYLNQLEANHIEKEWQYFKK